MAEAEAEQETRASGRQWQQTKRTRASIWQPRATLACLCMCVCVLSMATKQLRSPPLSTLLTFSSSFFSHAPPYTYALVKSVMHPQTLLEKGVGCSGLCSNSSSSSHHHRHPNNSHLFNTPAHPTTSLRCSTAYRLTH